MGIWVFGRCGERFGRRRGVPGRCFVAVLGHGARVSGAAMMVGQRASDRQPTTSGTRAADWPQRGCSGPGVVQSVPGHEEGLPVGFGAMRGRPGLTPAGEGLDDDHMPTAARARRTDIERLVRYVVITERWRDGEEFAGACEVGRAGRSGEQAVVADAMEPARQNVKQEAADELVGAECHDALPVRAIAAIILVAEGDAGRVEGEQPPVRDGDAVSVAREIGEHRFGAGEGRLGVDHPAFLADRREVAQEGAPVSERREAAEEAQACRRRGVRSAW